MADPTLYGYMLEGALCLAGLILIGVGCSRYGAAWRRENPGALAPWPGQASELFLYLFFALAGGLALPSLTALALRHTRLDSVETQVWEAFAFQAGMLLGMRIFSEFHRRLRQQFSAPNPAAPNVPSAPAVAAPLPATAHPIRSGVLTFLLALPLVFSVSFLWLLLLERCGFTARPQDVVDLFQNIHTPAMRILFVFVAIVVAPLTEELLFRAGIFRFLNGRLPRGWAVTVSALLFGGMHLLESPADGLGSFLPLVVLGAVFALAYQRTGRLRTTVVAHALFNLNTLVALLLGVNS